jgi:hypothetical protein
MVLKPRQIHWATPRTEYKFHVYCRGKLNTNAEVLSIYWEHTLGKRGKSPILSDLRLFNPGQLQMESQELKPRTA